MTLPNQPLIDRIAELRMEGLTSAEIAERVGRTKAQVISFAHRHNLPRKPRNHRTVITRLKVRLNMAEDFTHEELATLDRLAGKWGCVTLSEAALEILKDALAEAAE
jgi:transposase